MLVFGGTTTLSDDASVYLSSIGTTKVYVTVNAGLLSGLYLLHPSGAITTVYRLDWDHNFALEESATGRTQWHVCSGHRTGSDPYIRGPGHSCFLATLLCSFHRGQSAFRLKLGREGH
jgi:hypothetical protein